MGVMIGTSTEHEGVEESNVVDDDELGGVHGIIQG
jgi:hypothetical protein